MSSQPTEIESNDMGGSVPLSYGETALVIKRLHDMGLSVDQISEKTDMDQSKVRHLLALVSLPTPIFELFKSGEVAGSIALRMVTTLGGDKAYEHLRQMLETHGVAVFSAQAETLIAELMERLGIPMPPLDADEDETSSRLDGFYRVLLEGQWTIARYFAATDDWAVMGEGGSLDDADFDLIDSSPINMPAL